MMHFITEDVPHKVEARPVRYLLTTDFQQRLVGLTEGVTSSCALLNDSVSKDSEH